MGDPLSDPRAQGLLSADLGEISALGGLFHRVASQCETAAAGLQGANDATWTGAAADAFRSQLGKLPDDLGNIQSSYAGVAGALDTYGAHLEPIRTQFVSLVTQLTDARSSLSTAQGQVATAKTNLSTATSAPHATSSTPAVINAHTALQGAVGTAGRLADEVSGLETRGYRLLDEFDTIRGSARGRISDAGGRAPSHHWWQSAFSAVGNFVKDAAVDIGKSVWNLVSGKAIMDFIRHPGWATLGELVKDIAITASLVAMIAAPFAAPELAELDAAEDASAALLDGGAEDAATETITETTADTTETTVETTTETTEGTVAEGGQSLGSVARGVNAWGNRAALAGNGFGAVDDIGQGHYGAAALDAGFMLVPNLGSTGKVIGAIKGFDSAPDFLKAIPKAVDSNQGFGDWGTNLLHLGDKSAEEALDTAKNMTFYKGLRELGIDDPLAKKIAFGEDVPAMHVDWNGVATSAANRAMHFGKPAAYLFDSLVSDPTDQKIQHKLHLVPDDG